MGKIYGVCRSVIIVFTVMSFLNLAWAQRTTSSTTTQKIKIKAIKEITGVVKTENGDPIAGAIVRLRGTNIETETNAEGKYTFNVKKGDKIQFVYIGYKTTTITVRKSNVLNVKMKEDDLTDLADITIICSSYRPYPSTTFKDTVALPISKIISLKTSSDRSRNSDASLLKTLIWRSVWFDFSKRYNPSQRNPETILKDVQNLTRNGNYTYVVDGVCVSEETFRLLNQNDIESVDVYKHTDVYNARFGNNENQSRITLEAR